MHFVNNIDSGSAIVITGDLIGATTSCGTSAAGFAMTTLGNVVDAGGDQIVFGNVVRNAVGLKSTVISAI